MTAREMLTQRAAEILADGVEIGPRVDPCSCGAGRHEHGGSQATGKCERTQCRRYRADQAYALAYAALDADAISLGGALAQFDDTERQRHYRRNPRGEGEWSIGASDTQTCPRKIQYRNAPPEDFEPLPEDNREARMGTIIHNEVTRQMKALYPWRMFAHRVTIPGLDRQSELDMYDPITAVLTDFKCTTRETLVLMADGSQREAQDIEVGDQVVAWDAHRNRYTSAPIVWAGDNGEHAIHTVTTTGGRRVRCTDNHPFLVDRRGKRVWVKAADLVVGDRAVVALGWQPEADSVSTTDAYLLGALVGDGGLSGVGRGARGSEAARFHNIDREVISTVEEALGAHHVRLGAPDHRGVTRNVIAEESGNTRAARQQMRAFRDWVVEHDLAHLSRDKRVPNAVLRGSEHVMAQFLSGMLDTDGTIGGHDDVTNAPTVAWTSASQHLMRDMQTLLAALGVRGNLSGMSERRLGGQKFSAWTLSVQTAYGVRRLHDLLAPRGPKAERLRQAAANAAKRVPDADVRPVNYDLARVTSITVSEPEPTVALEVAAHHSHVTGGLVTHNTAGDWRWDRLGADGPDWSTWEQVLLYGLALIAAGYRVERIRLVYVKRCNGHDEVFEMAYDPDAAEVARERLLGYAEALDRGQDLPKTGSGPSVDGLCRRCLSAETEVITDRGVRRIGEIVGERVHILDGNGGWVEAEAKAFGVQSLMKLTLRRRGVEKVVHATRDHGWFAVGREVSQATVCPECDATGSRRGPFTSNRSVRQHMARAHPETLRPHLPDNVRVRVETQDLTPGTWLSAVRAKSTPRKGQNPIIPAPDDGDAPGAGRWQVVGVEETDRVEETYCFEVPTTHSFVLADNLLTSNCFARADCWNIPRAEAMGRSPENLTILGEFPAEPEVIWAIGEKVTASEARLAAEKVEDQRKALVDGLSPGRYGSDGEWEVWEAPQAGRVQYKPSYERVLELLTLPDGQRPSPDTVEPIKSKGTVALKVGRTRKATIAAEKKARAALDKGK